MNRLLLLLGHRHFSFPDLIIEYLQILDVIPDADIEHGANCDEAGGNEVHQIPEPLAIVQPAVPRARAGLAPHQTRLIENCAEEYRTGNEGEETHQHQAEAHRHGFILFRNASERVTICLGNHLIIDISFENSPHRDEEITRSAGGTSEFEQTHHREEEDELPLTINRT